MNARENAGRVLADWSKDRKLGFSSAFASEHFGEIYNSLAALLAENKAQAERYSVNEADFVRVNSELRERIRVLEGAMRAVTFDNVWQAIKDDYDDESIMDAQDTLRGVMCKIVDDFDAALAAEEPKTRQLSPSEEKYKHYPEEGSPTWRGGT